MMTSSSLGSLLVLTCAFLPLCSAQESCSNRCGETYYRGHSCHCDYDCLIHSECCMDYESSCTTSDSCKGRCGESFKRGRQCSCDDDCMRFNQCCPDYQGHCGKAPLTSKPIKGPDVSIAHTQSPPGSDNDSINQEQIQGDESVGQTPASLAEGAGPMATLTPDNMSGQEVLPTYTLEEMLNPNSVNTPPNPGGTSAPWIEQEAIKGDIFTPFPEDPMLTQSSTGAPPFTENADVSPAVPATEPPIEIRETSPATEGESNLSPTTMPELTNPSSSPVRGGNVINSEISGSQIPQIPDATGSAECSPSTNQNSDDPTSSDGSVSGPTNCATSPDETPAVAPVPSPHTEADDASATSPARTQDQSGPSVSPLTGTAALTGPVSPGSTAGADAPLAGNDLKSPTSGPVADPQATPADDAQDAERQPGPSGDPMTDPLMPTSPSLRPFRRPDRPSTLTDIAQALATYNPNDYLPEDNNDTDLCSGRPISGLTTLHNGTVVVFRGHYFWVLDANRSPGPARGITEVWGIPSPIDTVFSRCNCQGKTYFFKGNNFWRFDNDVMDEGYPKAITVGFDKLAGKITAALSVPVHRSRRESVYFFKRGGLVQKYTYKNTPSCGKRVPFTVYTVRNRLARQAVPSDISLGKEINIKIQWKGFPSFVTSAVSIPNPRKVDGYDYHIFSRNKHYNIKIEGEQPALATPLNAPSQQNSAKTWFKCP
ncbi:hypothetical protein AGOR_G00144180 [Albula goreensis]|uniref:SMB domain-containing protein n=1 Tax=Albula goreensis TaxID=1534307 RepID=A0A8T3D1G2_9TELE|nr:hypothetical protein AGOR_G00144180 [Albula goreensis]